MLNAVVLLPSGYNLPQSVFGLQVDQPGSLIDTYVEKLELIIQEKSKGIQDLQHLLNSFKGRLQQEEVFSKSMGKNKRKGVLK